MSVMYDAAYSLVLYSLPCDNAVFSDITHY